MNNVIWVVEVRDANFVHWWRHNIFDTRAEAREWQVRARRNWRHTRIVKYVREVA